MHGAFLDSMCFTNEVKFERCQKNDTQLRSRWILDPLKINKPVRILTCTFERLALPNASLMFGVILSTIHSQN